MARCKASTKAGDQCRNNAIPGTKFCYISSHGDIKKTLRQRAGNFIRNNWLSLVLCAISLAATGLGLSWEFHARQRATNSGVMSSSFQKSPMAVSVGSAEFVMFSKDGIVFDDGKVPLLSIRLVDGRLLVTAQIRDESGSV